jgi:hypothetical protein
MLPNIVFQDNEINRIIFHFNKSSLIDPNIPFWTIKHKGITYYVNHLESSIGFKTKNTPENSTTRASLQFKGKLKIQQELNEVIAYVS